MNRKRWQSVHRLCAQALEQPEALRFGWVEAACGADGRLREEVLSLLAVQDRGAGLDDLPAAWLTAAAAPEPTRFETGERIAGRYEVRRLLGRGGMGEVYECWDEELGIRVALKTLRFVGGSEAALRRLKLEGLLARSVWHPNVCRVYDLGRHDGESPVWFLTMEVLRGAPLSQRLEQGPMPLPEAARLAEQIAAGLGAAHRAGVVHRDFKPANVVLVRRDGGEQAVVTDFGTARAARRMAGGSEDDPPIEGTPAYMAPEQAHGGDVGPAADIYALGVVLFEMVTGALPFAGASARGIEQEPISPRRRSPAFDEYWEVTILRCLARDPAQRFDRVEDVALALSGRISVLPDGPVDLASRPRHSLPAERDRFVGREAEIAELERRLSSGSRLVTLLGPGGMGKTRLAVRSGWRFLERWPGGVWFCDLTEARTASGIAAAVAAALDVPLGRSDPMEQLGHAFAGRGSCLVLLDNFDHVTSEAEETLGRWMERAPDARFVVTSRERLNLESEAVLDVGPLTPATGLELLVDRARGLHPGIDFSGAEAEAAREIVRLTDAMPLAIELAAARMRVMSAVQIVEQMRKRFRLLTGGRDARHETLEGVIDGSWDQLRVWEQAAWAQCAVFEGGFTLDAAQAVLDFGAWPETPWVVDVLQSLVDRSLLRTWAPSLGGGGGPVLPVRFGMYATLQDYARLKLRSSNTARATAEARHGAWCSQYGDPAAIEALDRHGGVRRRAMLRLELDNLIAACRRASARGESGTAVACLQAAWEVLELCGPFKLGVELSETVLAMRLDGDARARAATVAGRAAWRCGRVDETRRHYEAALAIHRERGDRMGEGHVLGGLANLPHEQGRMDEARAQYSAALAIHREVGNRRSEGVALGNLAIVNLQQGRLDEALADFETALAIHREVGDRRFEGVVLYTLGALHYEQGRLDEARAHYATALDIHRETGDRRFESIVLVNLSLVDLAQGHVDDARAHAQTALAIHRELGDRRSEAIALGNLGNADLEEHRIEDARARFEAALAIHREVGSRQFEAIVLGGLAKVYLFEGEVDRARDALEKAEALLRDVDDSIGLAQILCSRAVLQQAAGDESGARRALAEAEGLAAQVGAGAQSEVGRELTKVRQTLRASR